MATFSIDEAIARIEALPDKVADIGVDIMKVEVPIGPTGALKAGVAKTSGGKWTRFIGSDVFYAKYVVKGRGPVIAHGLNKNGRPHTLHWMGYQGGQTSIHKADPGDSVFSFYASATEPNDYCQRTAEKLNGMHFSL